MQKMMKRFPLFIAMGFMIVVIAVIIGYLNAANAASYYAVDKATRDSSTSLAQIRAGVESTIIWLPYLKFLGLAMILAGITMALGGITQTLRDLGASLMTNWPDQFKPGMIAKSRAAKLFPMLMMMGWMLLLIGLIWAFLLNGTVLSYWSNSVATVLNPAESGSALLSQLGTITATLPWLATLRFLSMTLLFSAITLALTVVIRTLQFQEKSLLRFADVAGKS